ncbi:Protein of unknown function (DUF3455) domain containing protein [Elaphomyces granulatus]
MRWNLLSAAALMATATISAQAAPATIAGRGDNGFDDLYGFSDALAEYYSLVSRHIDNTNRDSMPVCDLSKAELPSQASGLPPASAGQKLVYVAIGRGTQNYTCSESSSSVQPSPIGALATLFDASCLAANFPDLLTTTINVVLNYQGPNLPSTLPPANLALLGHHYFSNSTTPVFAFDSAQPGRGGMAVTKKMAQMNAPAGSVPGQGNKGFGAVPWLYLQTVAGTINNYTSVYRVNTMGGSPPTNCTGISGIFTIQYAAAYFIFSER